jgi:hypothetical protein
MPLGDDNDFRTSRWQVARRFPGLMERGGDGSAMIPSFNRPTGYSDISMPPIGIPPIPGTTITLPGISVTGGPEGGGGIFPPIVFPPITFPTIPVGGGGAAGTTITVETTNDGSGNPATYTGITTIEFTGSNLTSVIQSPAGTAVVDYSGGGGGGGSTLVYGTITGATKNATTAVWTYSVQPYSNGTPSGSAVTANNLLERGNTNSTAYGYTLTGAATGDIITGTNFYIRSVPIGTWVRMEFTDEVTGTSGYWFSAPNRIDGTC